MLDREFRRFTSKTITDPKAIKRKLKEIKRKGISLEQGELDEDVHIMAAPVFDHTRRPVAAVAIGVPAYRMKSHMRGNTMSLLKETAAKISARLHCTEEY